MRKINEIILHCTADEYGVNHDIEYYNRIHRERGFRCCGYHYVIDVTGKVLKGRSINEIGAHCRGHNAHSIGIAYIGGLLNGEAKNTLNYLQIGSLRRLLSALLSLYNLKKEDVHLHNEYSNKKCPCFNKKYLHDVLLK